MWWDAAATGGEVPWLKELASWVGGIRFSLVDEDDTTGSGDSVSGAFCFGSFFGSSFESAFSPFGFFEIEIPQLALRTPSPALINYDTERGWWGLVLASGWDLTSFNAFEKKL